MPLEPLVPSYRDKKKDVEKGRALLDSIECCHCYEIATTPLYQCNNEHIVCSECQSAIRKGEKPKCPVCLVPMTEPTRNVDLEAKVANCAVSCRYKHCKMMVKHSDLADHLLLCDHRPVQCLVCFKKVASWGQLRTHHLKKHTVNNQKTPWKQSPSFLREEVLKCLVEERLDGIHWNPIQIREGDVNLYIFPVLRRCEHDSDFLCFSAREMGPLSKEVYQLKVSCPKTNITVSSLVQAVSYRISTEDRRDDVCLAISADMLKHMSKDYQYPLEYTISLSRDPSEPRYQEI